MKNKVYALKIKMDLVYEILEEKISFVLSDCFANSETSQNICFFGNTADNFYAKGIGIVDFKSGKDDYFELNIDWDDENSIQKFLIEAKSNKHIKDYIFAKISNKVLLEYIAEHISSKIKLPIQNIAFLGEVDKDFRCVVILSKKDIILPSINEVDELIDYTEGCYNKLIPILFDYKIQTKYSL